MLIVKNDATLKNVHVERNNVQGQLVPETQWDKKEHKEQIINFLRAIIIISDILHLVVVYEALVKGGNANTYP